MSQFIYCIALKKKQKKTTTENMLIFVQDEGGSVRGSGSEGGSPPRSSPGRYGRDSPAASEDEDDFDSEEEEEYDDRPRKKRKGVSNFIIDEAGEQTLSVHAIKRGWTFAAVNRHLCWHLRSCKKPKSELTSLTVFLFCSRGGRRR